MLLRFIALCAFAISVGSGYAWLVSDRVPKQDDLVAVEGAVSQAEHLRTATHSNAVTAVKFWLPQDPEAFFYQDFFPNFERAKQLIAPGTMIQLSTVRGKHEVWQLQAGGEIIATQNQIAGAHHSNGTWGLAVSIMMALSGGYLWRIGRSPSASSTRRRWG